MGGSLIEKISRESKVIIIENILNKSKDLSFVCFVLSVFFQRSHTCVFACISVKADFKKHIRNIAVYNIERFKFDICSI